MIDILGKTEERIQMSDKILLLLEIVVFIVIVEMAIRLIWVFIIRY